MLNMLATLAEYERELIVERVTAAKLNGTRFGRPLSDPAIVAEKLAIVREARVKGRAAAINEDLARATAR